MSRLFGIADALDSDAWYTPPWVFDGLDIVFDLDVAAPEQAFHAASSVYVPAKRLQFVNGHGGKVGAVNFTAILLGRGSIADRGIELASLYGGSARGLSGRAA